MKDKIYPAIYESTSGELYLYLDTANYHSFASARWRKADGIDVLDHENDTSVTTEYLQNTYGEVVSPEHAEFIIELAELHGFKVIDVGNENKFFYLNSSEILFTKFKRFIPEVDSRKQITIPLPPKADNQELSEWPCVGSVVTWGNKSVKGEVKALSDGLAWIKNEYGNYCSEYVSSLQKPKTPAEELRDNLESEIKSMVNFTNYNPRKIAEWIIGGEIEGLSYDIKKKPQ